MDLSIVISSYNRGKILIKTITQLIDILCKGTLKFEIIVVNDGNEKIISEFKNTRVIQNKGKGVASARNFGLELATSENILFLDDDILINEASLDIIFDFFNNYKKDSILYLYRNYSPDLVTEMNKMRFGRYLIYKENYSWEKWIENSVNIGEGRYSAKLLASYCLAVKKSRFVEVGMYSTDFPFAGFEDYELSERLLKNGFLLILHKGATVYHNESDRLDVKEWLKRRYREGATLAVFVDRFGKKDLKIEPSYIKKVIFNILYFSTLIQLLFIKISAIFLKEKHSFYFFDILAGSYIYKGYEKYSAED